MSDIDNPDIWLTRARSSLARAGQVLCLKLRRVTCISLTNKQKVQQPQQSWLRAWFDTQARMPLLTNRAFKCNIVHFVSSYSLLGGVLLFYIFNYQKTKPSAILDVGI